MSEVLRYLIQKTPIGTMMKPNLEGNWISAEDFDRVTAERDAALAELDMTRKAVPNSTLELVSLQQRLTAADERNDNRDSEIFAQVQSALRRSFSLGQIYWQQADSDSTCQQNKSDQTMEVQEQHILNVLKSLGAALKPAEGRNEPNCLRCLDKKTVPSNLAEGYVMDCPDCCGDEG